MQKGIIVLKQREVEVEHLSVAVWDELGNVHRFQCRFIWVQKINFAFGLLKQARKWQVTILSRKALKI